MSQRSSAGSGLRAGCRRSRTRTGRRDLIPGRPRRCGRPRPDGAVDAPVSGTPTAYHETVGQRRARRERQRGFTPPAQVPADARIFLGKRDITPLAIFGREVAADAGTGLRGSAVSPGRVTAPARRISSVKEFGKLRPGEVLVAPHLAPAWSSLPAIAGGVVTDAGGVLSHSSIAAREYGIPAVMGTHEATGVIRDGQVVTVDGDRGLVY